MLISWTFFGWAVQALGLLCLVRFLFQKPKKLTSTQALPSVSILKPCYGASDNEIENFDAFFNQNYPGKIQIIFSVSTENDASIPVIESYLKKYPQFDATLLISKTRNAAHLKFDALYDAQLLAKNEIMIWSDADTIVDANYVSDMVSSLQEKNVSVVTTPQFDTRMNTAAAAIKGLGNNADVATLVMIYNQFKPTKAVAWGHSIGFYKSKFDALDDPWGIINRFIVDDQAIPYLFNRAGQKTVFKNIFCPVQWSGKTWKQVHQQKKYWAMFQQAGIGNKFSFSLGVLLYPMIPATLLVLFDVFSAFSISIWLGVYATRLLASFISEVFLTRSYTLTFKYFWSVLVWDLIQPYYYWYAFNQKTIKHSGKEYKIKDRYFLET